MSRAAHHDCDVVSACNYVFPREIKKKFKGRKERWERTNEEVERKKARNRKSTRCCVSHVQSEESVAICRDECG